MMNALPEPARHHVGRGWSIAHRCAVCARRLRGDTRLLQEAPDVPDPQTWVVCPDCYASVHTELARSALQTPLRLRIAVGVVASQHERPNRYSILDNRFWDQLTDEGLNRLLIWVFLIAFGVHALAFMLVAAYVVVAH